MAEKSYLVVKNGDVIKRYECKNAHNTDNSAPYIRIKAGTIDGYLDLTTQTTTGVRPQISNVTGQIDTTSTRSSSYESISGYSGVSGVTVTDGYSRTEIAWDKDNMQTYTATQITVSSQTSYTGEVWNLNYSSKYPTNVTTTTTADYIGVSSISQSKWNTLTGASQLKRTWNESNLTVSAKINDSAYKLSTYSSVQSTTYYPYANITDVSMFTSLTKYAVLQYNIMDYFSIFYPTTISEGNIIDWGNKKITMSTTYQWYDSTGYNFFTGATLMSDIQTKTQSYSKTHFEGISANSESGMLYGTFGFETYESGYTHFYTNTNYSFQYGNTTTITKYKTSLSTRTASVTFSYKTSEELADYISGTWVVTGYLSKSYKHINYYNTWDISTSLSTYSTSSIQPGNMSSTTALTIEASRESQYDTTISTTAHYKPVNSVSVTVTKMTYNKESYYTGVKSKTSEYTETTGYSGISESERVYGYTGISSRESTSGYTGYLTAASTTWEGNDPAIKTSYSGTENYTSYTTGAVDDYDTAFARSEKWAKTASTRNTSSSKLTTGVSSRYWDAPAGGWLQNITILKEDFNISTTYPINSFTATTYYNTYPSNFTSTQSNSQTYQTLTSSVDLGQLVSTTALTSSSTYSSSSSTTNEALSSTTLLVVFDHFESSSTDPGEMFSTTALTTTSSRSSEYTMTTTLTDPSMYSTATTSGNVNYTTTVEVIREESTPTGTNNVLNIILNGIFRK